MMTDLTDLEEWLDKNDPTNLGTRIAALEKKFTGLSKNPDQNIKTLANYYLSRVNAMKRDIRNGIQNPPDAAD